MEISLVRAVNIKQIELIAEVDFSDTNNPYNELLKNLNTIDDIKLSLKNAGVEDTSINFFINKFKKLKVINNGKINKNIVSTREYGKYEIIYLENDRLIYDLPIEIKRIKPGKNHNISNLSNSSIIIELNKSKFYNSYNEENKKFRIFELEKNKEGKYLGGNSKNIGIIKLKWSLDLKNNKDIWYLEGNGINRIEKSKNMDFTDERINSLLSKSWDSKNKAMNITFNDIKSNNKAINNFYLDFNKDITFDEFGNFNGEFKSIPIIPIDKNNAMEWFISLFKKDILNLNRYFSYDELEQIWSNEFEKTPISEKFELNFNFKNIVSQFDKNSKVYWQLMAGKDLNPFDIFPEKVEINNVIIKSKNNIDIEEDIFTKIIGDNKIDELTIIDTYITNNRHYKSLKKLVHSIRKSNNNTVINIFTKSNNNEIIERVKNLDINYNALNRKLPHNRLWILKVDRTERYFNVSHSIDFIKYSRNSDNFYINEDIIFTELNQNEVDKKFFEILGEENE